MTELQAVAIGIRADGVGPVSPGMARRRILAVALLGVGTAAALGLALSGVRGRLDALGWQRPVQAPPALRVTSRQQQAVASLTVDDQAQIVGSGKLAESRNAAIPVARLPLEHVRGFLLPAVQPATALTCLTQAVYYEAGFEPAAGKRAVAQVVLNRMRHPAYPKSVCGVVYQGSERRTGCQFSFTCDGSLLRPPAAAAWRAAQEVARAALGGQVEPSVGTATHYHADYVLPKWAFQLAKIGQIGAHIFYRFNGGWGRSSAFTGAYSGREWIPSLNYAALREREASGGLMPSGVGAVAPSAIAPAALVDAKYPKDVGGRVNVTKLWRLKGAGAAASSGGEDEGLVPGLEELKPLPVSNSAASALPEE